MGRPKIANPKNRHIGIVTTESKFRRFKALNLVGDQAIDALLYYLENENSRLNVEKQVVISNIKNIEKQIDELELEKLKQQTRLDEINSKIGFADTGLANDVEKAIRTVLQRHSKFYKEVFSIDEYLELKKEKSFLQDKAAICNMELNEFKELVINYS